MQKLIDLLGAGDGQGNTSSSRVLMYLAALAVIVPKVYISIKTATPPAWTTEDFALLGIGGGIKLINSKMENDSPATPPAPISTQSTATATKVP